MWDYIVLLPSFQANNSFDKLNIYWIQWAIQVHVYLYLDESLCITSTHLLFPDPHFTFSSLHPFLFLFSRPLCSIKASWKQRTPSALLSKPTHLNRPASTHTSSSLPCTLHRSGATKSPPPSLLKSRRSIWVCDTFVCTAFGPPLMFLHLHLKTWESGRNSGNRHKFSGFKKNVNFFQLSFSF